MTGKKTFPLILILLFASFVPLQGQGFIFQKDIYVAENQIEDNVMSFGGTITIKGKVEGSVISFGGIVIIEGTVEDTLLGIGSEITLKSTAIIKEDVVSIGGTLERESGAEVLGDTINFNFETTEEVRRFLKEGLTGIFGLSWIPVFLILKLITLFIWFILAIALAAILPRQISYASSQIRTSFWPVVGTGLLSLIVFTMLFIFSALLSFILIGIPILVSLAILGVIIKIFSRVVLFYFFGESLCKAFGGKHPSPFLSVIIGFLVVSLISLIPIIGSPLFTFVLSIIGWGVVIRTKFGTTENWFQKK